MTRAVSGATRAKIGRSLARVEGPTTGYDTGAGRAVKKLTSRQKALNIQRHARTKKRAGTIGGAEYSRRMAVSGRLNGQRAAPKKPAPVMGGMQEALEAMLGRHSDPRIRAVGKGIRR